MPLVDQSSLLPAQVQVRFASRRCVPEAYLPIPLYYLSTVKLSDLGYTFKGSPAPAVFHDTALATFDATGAPPTNKTALDTLAKRIAADYYAWQAASFDRVYNGILNLDVTGYYDEIIIDYEHEDPVTRIHTKQYNADPQELSHHDPNFSACTDNHVQESCVRVYAPPATGGVSSGTIPVTDICIRDGRLIQTYVRTDSDACGCVPEACAVFCPTVICHDFVEGDRFLPGVLVTLTRSGMSPLTCITDTSGTCCIPVYGMGTGIYTATFTGPNLQTVVTNFFMVC